MGAAVEQFVDRLVRHVPASGQRVDRTDHTLVGDGSCRLAGCGGFGQPGAEAVLDLARALALGCAEVQAARFPRRYQVAQFRPQVGQAPAFPNAPVGFHQPRVQARLQAEQAGGRDAAGQRAGDPGPVAQMVRQDPGADNSFALGRQGDVGAALDETFDVPGGRAVAQDEQVGHRDPVTWRKRASSVWEAVSKLCSVAAMRVASLPMAARRASSVNRDVTAWANSGSSPTSVSSPVTPSRTMSGTPPVRPATTGSPAAWASSRAMP